MNARTLIEQGVAGMDPRTALAETESPGHVALAKELDLSPEEYYVAQMLTGLNPGGRKDAIVRYHLDPQKVQGVQQAPVKKGYAKVNAAGAVQATSKTHDLHKQSWKVSQFMFYTPPPGLKS